MRKILHSFTLLLFACGLLLGSAQEARASHLLGGDMTYVSLGNNQYRVKFRLYRDCTGITPSANDFLLSCRNGGCNATATVTAQFVQQGAVEAGNPFCAAVSAGPCQGPAGLPNYDVYNYLATVTLTPGNWTLSTFSNARPTLANVQAGDMYVEATLDNRNQGTTAVANNSPQFDPQDIPIQYVCWKQPTTITYSATEPDGDSLVYTLAAPLRACGTPVTYNTFPGSARVTKILSQNPLCVYDFPGLPTGLYSPTNPIQLGFDTVGTCPVKTGVVRTLTFNQQARTLSFTPGVFDATAAPNSGNNKYQIAVLITEYRRINGVRRVIGTVRREANIIVIDCGPNTTPNPVTATPVTPKSGTQTVNTTDTTRIDVRTCNYSRVELNFTDPDNLKTPSANQLLTVTLPANINTDPNLLDSGDVGTFSLTGNGTTNPRGVFFFQPSPTTLGRTIRLNIRVEDNNCPIKGVQNRVVVIRIYKGFVATASAIVGATGIGNTTPASNAICPGGSLTLQGGVVRPDSIRRIATNTTQAQVYTYQWSVANAGGNGLPAVTTNQQIVVSPTVTTRYRLTASPTLGFAQGSCGDTTSILVRVVPQPVVAATASVPSACIGTAVTLRATATRPTGVGSNLNDTYTYTWSGPGITAPNNTGATLPVTPTALGVNTYTVTARGASPYACTATSTVQVLGLAVITAKFAADSTGAAGKYNNRPPVTFTFTNQTTPVVGAAGAPTTYAWTYQRFKDLSNSPVADPVVTFSSAAAPAPLKLTQAGYYRVRLTTSVTGSANPCGTLVAERIVFVPDLQVPNIITPNGDGQNDFFRISSVNSTTSKLEIFNRWGRKVYEQSNYANNWGGDNQPAGVYYYLLTDNKGVQTKGWVEVVR
ncbi:gliding motility-associated C-terminal domain-containing protein [Hymenobacter sp. BT523]|nr:gliding motility-associated C-terminal domain-containing protein [Hymenobacter sp. BT523]MBJ6111056.1 gliding motility-associated C-terminal domain-containing protein [Hymenobacter sp. BT523]